MDLADIGRKRSRSNDNAEMITTVLESQPVIKQSAKKVIESLVPAMKVLLER